MKKYLISCLILTTISVSAQEKLSVEYESKMEFDVNKNGFVMTTTTGDGGSNTKIGADKEMEAKLKEAMSKPAYFNLTLTPNESEFKVVEKVSNDQPSEGGMQIKLSAGGGTTYKNLNENISLKAISSFNQDFLITDALRNYDWKISKESKEILGYEARKATAVVDSVTNIVAWYAPKLTYKNGPDVYGGLPGLIMEIEANTDSHEKGKRKVTYKAVSVNVINDKKGIERPKKGKKMTQEDFTKWTKEQMEKMREMYGGGVDKD